ncbi:MAG: hypothetical protein GKR89_35900 [Candidatus Latescibacteria bacterium]|nr:hypothetical protein [Candidatus Latescibacterota bacterium]
MQGRKQGRKVLVTLLIGLILAGWNQRAELVEWWEGLWPAAPTLVQTDIQPQTQRYAEPGQIAVGTFNIRMFSNNSRDDRELALIADRLQPFDLVALQEVRDTVVVGRTVKLLGQRGQAFQSMISPPVGNRHKERYAFLWRGDQVTVLEQGTLYLDVDDVFLREPYFARFQAGSFDFALVTLHAIYGQHIRQRRAEAQHLDRVFQAVQTRYPDEGDILFLGDFNLPPNDPALAGLAQQLTPLFTGPVRTTISDRSLYDHIWIDPLQVLEFTGRTGMDRFDEYAFANDDKAASLAVSDHRPVWAAFKTEGPDDD